MDLFVARQPILDRGEKLLGYELLFRDGLEAGGYSAANGDGATSRIMLEGLSAEGFESLTGGRVAFLNVTREVLVSGLLEMLSPEHVVIELLETIPPDDEVLSACRELRLAGFRLAIDDFGWDDLQSPFLEVADQVKIDFLATTPDQRRALARKLAHQGKVLVAEKVESRDDHASALAAGYHYFQGYYYSRPVMIASRLVPGVKLRYLEVLSEMQRPSFDYARIERIVKSDLSLTYRLLRLANSAYASHHGEIATVGQALLRVGEREFRRLVTLVTMAGLAADQPEALVVQALSRARFAEMAAHAAGKPARAEEAFLAGMLSLLDAMLGRPLAEVLPQLSLSPELQDALIERRNDLGGLLRYVEAWERGDWETLAATARTIGLDETRVPAILSEAAAYSHDAMETIRAKAA